MPPDDTPAARDEGPPATTAVGAPLPTIPGYRLQRRLGQGGMAVVYLAVQRSLDREVAIKIMAPTASTDEAQAQRFEHEGRIIAKLEHPGIVGIHEVGRTAEGQLYYVMPYLARGDLSQRDYRHDESRIIDLLRGLLDALGYAHARGIVHRDVKAENVLFNNADRPQLTDFGIALSRGGSKARITTDGLALGSGGYMSPEQARGEPVDGRADLYSLGVLAYELLSGELPYEAEDPLALALMHATDPVPSLPPEKAHWQSFIDTAMAKSPDKRFRNAQIMARALDPIARQLLPSSGVRAALANRHWHRPGALIAVGMGVALVLAAFLFPVLRSNQTNGASPATNESQTSVSIPPEIVAPSVEEQRAQQNLLIQQAQAQLAAGALISPAGANAAESFLSVLKSDPIHPEAREGLDRVLTGLGERVVASVGKNDHDAIRERFEQARLLAESAQLQGTPAWTTIQTQTREALGSRIETDLGRYDGASALVWADLAKELGLEDSALLALRARIATLPAPGATLRDGAGPEFSHVPSTQGRSNLDHAFGLMRNEVTRGEYAEFIAATRRGPSRCRNRYSPLQFLDQRQWNDPGFAQSGKDPVVCVSFDDARAYATWLSRRTGKTYRLPTAQEWRHALAYSARGAVCVKGNVLDRSAGGTSAHACNDGAKQTRSVRSYAANGLGVFDLVGNASEWTLDCGEAGNPVARLLERKSCARRAAAGVSWRDGSDASPATHRQMLDPSRGYDDVGFRLVREL